MKLIVEKNVQIPIRDGTLLYADIFRPNFKEKVPVLFNTSVYQKDKLWSPPADLEEKANPYMCWETVNPMWWCPRGYSLSMAMSQNITRRSTGPGGKGDWRSIWSLGARPVSFTLGCDTMSHS